jgi:rRNA-processing protein FCF1
VNLLKRQVFIVGLLVYRMEVILDTNFVVACVRQRIDFVEKLNSLGFSKVVVPREVIEELKDLKNNGKVSRDGKAVLGAALEIVQGKDIKKTRLGNRSVDTGLIEKGKSGIYIGTLDREIKRNVANRVVLLSAKKSLGIERD